MNPAPNTVRGLEENEYLNLHSLANGSSIDERTHTLVNVSIGPRHHRSLCHVAELFLCLELGLRAQGCFRERRPQCLRLVEVERSVVEG